MRRSGRPSIGVSIRAEKSLSDEDQPLHAGDLVWIDFDPRVGREQSGRRPALIISPIQFWKASRFAIVCPITSRVRPFASSVVLPDGLPIAGEILVGQVRSIDTAARSVTLTGATVSPGILADVRAKLAALSGIA
jgi:mRNA interferase MazF